MPTTTVLLTDAASTTTLFLRLVATASEIWLATAWASDGTPVANALWKARARLASLAVGLDFHQTDPRFLRRFRAMVRVYETADGTFHPKVYVFRTGSRFEAILGSSNFTQGGFGRNVEANVHMRGTTSDPLFRKLTAFVEGLADDGRQMLDADLDHYEEAYRARDRDVASARRFTPRTRSDHDVPLHLPWDKYVRRLFRRAKMSGHAIHPRGDDLGYGGVIRDVQQIFKKKRTLARMTAEERKKVAGLVSPYGYFGSMKGAGHFMGLVVSRPANLDRALDHIPHSGPVTREHFDAFVGLVTRYKGMGKPAVGTRLLAMKRPDQFFCIDSANRRALGKNYGFTVNHLNSYDGYWELLMLLWRCPWFKSPRPKGPHRDIWDARVALVDAFYYES